MIAVGSLLLLFDNKCCKTSFILFLFYFGSIATLLIMGFSPTIYVSGARVQYIFAFMQVCIVYNLVLLLNPNIKLFYEDYIESNILELSDEIKGLLYY